MADHWQKQADNEPLFPALIWNKPETKQTAGKLLIIGGQKDHFSNLAKVYQQATNAGAGHIKVLVPDSLAKIIDFLPGVEFAPANASGGFGSISLANMLDVGNWADMVLLAGDFGKSSETTLVLDKFVDQFSGWLSISSACFESVDTDISNGGKTLLITNFDELQKFSKHNNFDQAFTSTMGAVNFARVLGDFSQTVKIGIVCKFENNLWVAVDGKVSSTPRKADLNQLAATSSVWLMQNPTKPYEALTTACYEIIK